MEEVNNERRFINRKGGIALEIKTTFEALAAGASEAIYLIGSAAGTRRNMLLKMLPKIQ
jgi:hypothetical protein